ncbi:MAG: protein BatD [Candidatus Omnitrophica bacterium]|nr:protein BatD [Candidatus Omnitrophota bacterium]
MKRLILVFIAAIALASQGYSFADEPQLTLSADKQSARVNEEIRLNVRIVGVRDAIQAPHLTGLDEFETFYSGRSSRFSFVNGRSESMTEFNYVLIPRSVGRFVVRPIEIKIGNKIYATNQLEINIENGQTVPVQTTRPSLPQRTVPPSAPFQPLAQQTQPPAQSTAAGPIVDQDIDQNIFLRVAPSQMTVFVNQQIILSYSLYTRYDTRYEGFIEEPETSGFWIEEFPMEQDIGRDTEMVNGKKYLRADVKKLALFPTAPGVYTIKPGVVKTSVQIDQPDSSMMDEFFSNSFFSGSGLFARRVEKHLSPAPIQIQVKPLPEEGKPASFNGAVGEFRMATTVDKRVVNQNEAVTLQINLEGEGNIETLVRPNLPEIPEAKIYEADTQTQLFRAHNLIAGKKTFEVVIIPGVHGELKIPSVEFSFFNPRTERYVILKSDPYKIKVNPSQAAPVSIPKGLLPEELKGGKKSIRSESEDIQYIKERIATSDQPLVPILVFWFALASGAMTVCCGALLYIRKRNEYLNQNLSLKRTLFAKKYAVQGLKRLDRLAKSSASDLKTDVAFFDESAHILNQYLSDKLNLSRQGVTRDLIARKLEDRQTAEEIIRKIHDCYETCDQIRFGKLPSQGIDRGLMIKNIREIIYSLEQR